MDHNWGARGSKFPWNWDEMLLIDCTTTPNITDCQIISRSWEINLIKTLTWHFQGSIIFRKQDEMLVIQLNTQYYWQTISLSWKTDLITTLTWNFQSQLTMTKGQGFISMEMRQVVSYTMAYLVSLTNY